MARVRRYWFPELCLSEVVVGFDGSVGREWWLVSVGCGRGQGTNRGGAAAVAMREIGITCWEGVRQLRVL